jgi:hypothetical protein
MDNTYYSKYENLTFFLYFNSRSLEHLCDYFSYITVLSSLGRYVFGSEISYNKAPPRLPGLAY